MERSITKKIISRSVNDAALLYFKNDDEMIAPSPEKMHPLFNNRNSFFIVRPAEQEKVFEDVLDWVLDRLDNYDISDISNEPIAVLTGRNANVLNSSIEGINFKSILRHAKRIKCVGISNWTFSLTDGCRKLIKGLNKGTEFEMIFLNPDGENTKLRSIEEKKDTRSQIIASFDMLKSELNSHFSQNPDKLGNQDSSLFEYYEKVYNSILNDSNTKSISIL